MNFNQDIKLKLRHILELSKCDHKVEIMKQVDILNAPQIHLAHIYCKINQLSGQVSGPLIEYYIKNKYNMTKNNASLCIGDLQYNNQNIEIKVSLGGKDNNKFNYVQLRMNHLCEYVLTAYYINNNNIETLGELFIFRLNKNNIKELIFNYGGYAHGTIQKLGPITMNDLNNSNNDKEYSLHTKYGDKLWIELLKYRIFQL